MVPDNPRVSRPPQPVLSAVDRDGDLIQVPFVDRSGSALPDATSEPGPETVYPYPDRFPADCHTPRGEKIVDSFSTERETTVDPDRIYDEPS